MLQLTVLDGEDVKLELSEFSLIEQLSRVIAVSYTHLDVYKRQA